MPRRYSPASLRLAAAGITHERVAARAGVERATITSQLVGRSTPMPYLIPAIRSLAGVDVANDVAEILGVEEKVPS